MRIGVLGSLRVEHDGSYVTIAGVRVRALLARLALEPGRTLPVEALAAALWPDGGPAQPTNAVQTLVSRLRRALPVDGVVDSQPGGYRLDLAPEAVDATRFERLVSEGRQALHAGEARTAADRLRAGLGLWRGDVLAGLADAPYAAAAATRLTELRLAATEDRIAADLQLSAPAALVPELRELTAAHPLRERMRVLLLRALHADGRTAEALAAYEDFRQLLADELGADPGPELRETHRGLLRGEAPPAAAQVRGNLRADLSSFVGRDEERRQIGAQLAQARLVTLVGPGGAGKTRLATAVARDLAEATPGGAWLVELAPVTDPSEVPQAVVEALGLRETGTPESPAAAVPDVVTRLVDALAATATLLVLDNCEHQLDAVAILLDALLGRCPHLRVLATSREPLGLAGETMSPVPPLPLPPAGTPPADAGLYPAVRLFADRAAAARPGFAVTDGNAGTVVEICRRLDGLPLAIELAAARLRSMTLSQVACRLDDRFQLLAAGSRAAMPRHRTLRAVVAWSWELLDDDEQRLARRLAVLPGVIVAEAAVRLGEPESGERTADVLAALVDKSLLQMLDASGDGPRYRMLETIREYGRERLAEAGELELTRARHTAYFLDLAERAAPHLRGAGQLPWMERLRAEEGSRAAYGYAHDTGDADTLVRLAAALGHLWTLRDDHAVSAQRLRLALAAPGPAPAVARAEVTAAYLLNVLLAGGDAGEAVAFARGVRAATAESDAAQSHPATALTDAILALADEDTASGLRATEPHLSGADPWYEGMLWLLRSWLHSNDGAAVQLRQAAEAAVAAFRAAGDRWGLAVALTHRAYGQTASGDFDGAVAGLREAIARQCELGVADGGVLQRVLLAAARAQQGAHGEARAELQQLLEPGTGPGSARNLVLARLALADLARLGGELPEAARQLDAAEQELARVPLAASLLRAMLLCARGHLAVAEGRFELAGWALAEALGRAAEVPDPPVVADIAVAVARLRWSADGGRSADGGGPAAGYRPPAASADGLFPADTAGRRPAELAAEVLGAAHSLRGGPDEFDPDVAALTDRLRGDLGERVFRDAYEQALGLERAQALALLQAQVP